MTGFFSNIEQKKTNVTGKEALWLQNEIREKEIYVTKVLASKEKRGFFKILELRQNYLDINKLIVLQHTTTHTTPPALVAPMPK